MKNQSIKKSHEELRIGRTGIRIEAQAVLGKGREGGGRKRGRTRKIGRFSTFFLSSFFSADTKEACPGGETGIRKGLKIPRPQGLAGSSPAPGTKQVISEGSMFFQKKHGAFLFSMSQLHSAFQKLSCHFLEPHGVMGHFTGYNFGRINHTLSLAHKTILSRGKAIKEGN